MKINYFLLSVLLFLLSACNDTELGDRELLGNDSEVTRGIVSSILGVTSKSNPTLYDDWENVEKIYLNGGLEIDPPWILVSGNSMNIPDDIRTDVKKGNGWTMLGHTILDQKSGEPNYILFYHKKSGILKGFYYSDTSAPNANAKWVLSSDKPSSMIPSNSREYHLSDTAQQYSITSNILNSNIISSIGALVAKWNCFTFELPYGTIHNNNPIVEIAGYNVHEYEVKLEGTLSGQVLIPSSSTSNSLDSWKNNLGIMSKLTGAAKMFSPLFEEKKSAAKTKLTYYNANSTRSIFAVAALISSAVSMASNIIGAASFFTSETKNVTHRYNFSGNIKLTGNSIGLFSGLAVSINNIDINRLNNNTPLGVWGLKELPIVAFNKYELGLKKTFQTLV